MFKSLEDILHVDHTYDHLRWSVDKPFEAFTVDEIYKYRRELIEIIAELSKLMNESSIPNIEKKQIRVVRRKLQDFEWNLMKEERNRERRSAFFERSELILNAQPAEEGIKASNFAMSASARGSDFYKNIPTVYEPQPRYGGGK